MRKETNYDDQLSERDWLKAIGVINFSSLFNRITSLLVIFKKIKAEEEDLEDDDEEDEPQRRSGGTSKRGQRKRKDDEDYEVSTF